MVEQLFIDFFPFDFLERFGLVGKPAAAFYKANSEFLKFILNTQACVGSNFIPNIIPKLITWFYFYTQEDYVGEFLCFQILPQEYHFPFSQDH